jgi:formylglycine-generating enzyme required for sulfatase activity
MFKRSHTLTPLGTLHYLRPGPRAVCTGVVLIARGVFTLASLFLALRLPANEVQISLTIEQSGTATNVVEVSCTALPGQLYRLFESPDLADWRLRETRLVSVDELRVAIPTSGAAANFFRVELVPIHPVTHMVWIRPGEFVMGSPPEEVGRFLDKEEPRTHVTLSHGYWMSRFEVTQEEFEAVLGFNPSLFKGEVLRPVENVSWFSAMDYCLKLTEREILAGRLPEACEYRLPTEAEWENAARAGTTTRFSYGDDPGYVHLGDFAWYGGNSALRPHPVGQKLPNPWGLDDMHGNVFEWCSDWFGKLPGGWVTDPQGPDEGTDRIIRGGYWDSDPAFCRSAMRVHFPPTVRISYLGFRVVLAEVAHQGGKQ